MSWWAYTRKPSVREQRERATQASARLSTVRGTNGRAPSPVRIEGRTIARSFWGKAWCANLESYRDYEYRLPRGRSYLRSGAVIDLDIGPGRIAARVAGSRAQPYEVAVLIKPLATARWSHLKRQCAGQIGSLIELLEGRLSDRVMGLVTDRQQGLFPDPAEIEMSCSCPDYATLCKHVAAALYGVGARLDAAPELLFTLRACDHSELLAAAVDLQAARGGTERKRIGEADLESVFGIELAQLPSESPVRKKRSAAKAKVPVKRSASAESRSALKRTARTGTRQGRSGRSAGRASAKR